MEPLEGQFFDIKVPEGTYVKPETRHWQDFVRFALIAVLAFLFLTVGNAISRGKEVLFTSQEIAYAGYEDLQMGVDRLLARDAQKAGEYFEAAEKEFLELQSETEFVTAQANQLTEESLYLDTAGTLLESALEVSRIGLELSDLMKDFSLLPQAILSVAAGQDEGIIDLLNERKEKLDEILASAASLQRKLTGLNTAVLPLEMQEKLASARKQIGEFLAALLDVDRNYDVVLRLLGDKTPHRYLVLLQNNHERRATGGFIGSYLLIDVNDGKISKLTASDVYESDGQLREHVEAPPGIDEVADRYYMRDANYSPDFPTSARQIMWFLEHSKGPSVDTVIAVDQSLVEALLTLTGPMRLEHFPLQISAENFNDVVSFYTEAKLSDSATPKQLLFDLIPALQANFKHLDLEALMALTKKMFEGGHVQVYSNDLKIQNLVTRIGADGAISKPDGHTDYLSVITTSIGGNKSDAFIDMDLSHKTQLTQKGEIIDRLEIQKTHTWDHNADTRMENLIARYGTGKLTKEDLYYILGRGPNTDYMRVYVPQGSQLQEVSGIRMESVEVYEDLGYTVFGFKNGPINAGEASEIILRYQLPFRLSLHSEDSYRFIAENQAGAENVHLKKGIVMPDGYSVMESYPPSEGFTLLPSLDTDFSRTELFVASISAP